MAVKNKAAGVASDILGQLAASIPTTTKPKSKNNKWEMVLTPEAREDAIRWIGAKVVQGAVDVTVDNAKSEFMEYALMEMAKQLFKQKTQPSNPLVVIKNDKGVVDHQFQVTMNDKFKLRFPDVPEGISAVQHFEEIFVSLGLHPTEAKNLVETELDFNPVTGLVNLNELLEGSYGEKREWIDSTDEQKEAGQKLAALLMWDGNADNVPAALTLEEKMMIIKRSHTVKVRGGFYGRICSYVQNVNQIMAIFSVIQPIIYPVYAKFGINSSEQERTNRKIEAAATILGTAVETEEE